MNILTKLSQHKKQLLIIFIILILSIAIFALINRPQTSSPSPSPFSPPVSTTPSYQPFYSTQPATNTPPQSEINLPQQVNIYTSPAVTIESVKQFFAPIVINLNFTDPPNQTTINSSPHLIWTNQSAYFDVNLTTSQFSTKPLAKTFFGDSTVTESQALNLAKNWLLQFQLIQPTTSSETTYLHNSGFELEESSNNYQGAYAYRFYFFPEINQLPIFTASTLKAPIVVDVASKGYIFQINYQLPTLLYSSYLNSPEQLKSQKNNILSSQEIAQAINNNQATIVSSKTDNGNFAPSVLSITKVNYQLTKLGYQSNLVNNQLIPIFQLTGQGLVSNNSYVNVTAYLPALTQ